VRLGDCTYRARPLTEERDVGLEHLTTYLSDHGAGAVAALELMAHVRDQHPGTETAVVVERIRTDVGSDLQELKRVMDRVGRGDSPARKAVAWLGERMMRLKLLVDDSSDGALRLFESLETIALGLEGKLALWQALAACADDVPVLQGVDYERLIARGREQRDALEPVRLEAARSAFR
jgi:hypothetical protein